MLAIRTAILPAVTTVFSAYEVLYAFERIAKLRDAARNRRRVETPRLAEGVDAQAAVASYASRVEQILSNERGQ